MPPSTPPAAPPRRAQAPGKRSLARARGAWPPPGYPLLLGLLAIVAYANAFRVPFLLDDFRLIENDPSIRPPISLRGLLATERPLVTASLALNYALGGLDVAGYHALNLVAHLACGFLVYGFAWWMLRRPPLAGRFGARAAELAAVAAGIFLLHPVQTGSVAYVIQRAEIFAAIATLAALWVAAAAAASGDVRRGLPAIVALGIASILSKPVVVALPLLFAAYDWCFLAEGQVGAMRRRWTLHATGLLLACAGAAWVLSHPAKAGGFEMADMTPPQYLASQPGVLLYYLRILVVPDRLCFDCGFLGAWPVHHSVIGDRVVLPALILLAVLIAAILSRRRNPLLAFAPLAAAGTLLPTSVFPLADVYFEHRLYLPLAFLALLAVTLAFTAGQVVVGWGWLPEIAVRRLRTAVAAAVLTALGALTIARNGLLADPLRLWQDTVAKAPEQGRAHNALGLEYRKRGQSELAVAHFEESVRRAPNLRVFVNLGAEEEKLGHHGEAIAAYEAARARNPEVALVQHNLARNYPLVGRLADAVAAAERAVALAPGNATYQKTLADLQRRQAALPAAPR